MTTYEEKPSTMDRAADAIDAARMTVADKMESAASLIRARADNVGAGARYLRNHGTDEMVDDLLAVIKAHPGKSVVVALLLGFMTARALRIK